MWYIKVKACDDFVLQYTLLCSRVLYYYCRQEVVVLPGNLILATLKEHRGFSHSTTTKTISRLIITSFFTLPIAAPLHSTALSSNSLPYQRTFSGAAWEHQHLICWHLQLHRNDDILTSGQVGGDSQRSLWEVWRCSRCKLRPETSNWQCTIWPWASNLAGSDHSFSGQTIQCACHASY